MLNAGEPTIPSPSAALAGEPPSRPNLWAHEGWLAPVALGLLTLAMLLPGTGTLPLIDRDEPRFAQATVEMIARHDWIVPTFNGNDRFDKPILTYWLMRAGYAVCGVGEWGARLHGIAAGLVLVLTTWWTGRRWFGAAAGCGAAAMLATCLQFFVHGRLALADMPMVACVALACLALGELLLAEAEPSPGWRRLLYGALGVGFLAKGPIAWALPLLAVLLLRWVVWRRPLPWGRLRAGRGLVAVLAMVALWAVPALIATDGRFFAVGIGEHVVQRGVEKFNGRGYTPFFYFATAPLSLFPWFGFAGIALVGARRAWDARTAWLVCWCLAPYLIFSCYATQLPHYVLPGFPAFFLLLARGWNAGAPRWARVVGWSILGVFVTVLVGALAWICVAEVPPEIESLRLALAGALLVLGGLSAMPLAWTRARAVALAGVAVVVAGGTALALGLSEASLTRGIGAAVRELPPGARKIGFGFAEPGVVFYGGTGWVFVETPAQLAAAVAQPGPLTVVSVRREIDPLRFFTGNVAWRELPPRPELARAGWRHESIRGLNLGRTRWQELEVSVRAP
jgi:4-amino-4-deoxy-L-arabinose transferase-like glycosyltransferase